MTNRIRELRRARGWTTLDLADRIGTTNATISRLETGERRLTVEWMNRIAAAFGVVPANLLDERPETARTADIGPPDAGYAILAGALGKRGLRVYRVLSDAVRDAGIEPGTPITVDETPSAIEAAQDGDCVVVDVQDGSEPPVRLLRQFIRPRTLITNRPGAVHWLVLDDPAISAKIIGVVLRESLGET